MPIRHLARIIAAAVLFAAPLKSQSQADAALRQTATRVMDFETRRQLVGATPLLVDSLLGLYADSIVYEHPNAGALIRGKAALRAGMLNFLGSIRGAHTDSLRVTVGHGVVIWEATTHMEVLDEKRWVPVTRHGIRIIEFDGAGKVRRLIDYPW